MFTNTERLALAGFLADYSGQTRQTYELDLRQLGALLVAAGLGSPTEHALISLLGKVVTIPLAPRTVRAIGLTVGERVDGPVFLASDGQRLDRYVRKAKSVRDPGWLNARRWLVALTWRDHWAQGAGIGWSLVGRHRIAGDQAVGQLAASPATVSGTPPNSPVGVRWPS